MLDTGSTLSLLPVGLLSDNERKLIVPTNATVTGTAGKSRIEGTLDLKLSFNNCRGHRLTVPNIRFSVLNGPIPILIGQDVLREAVQSFTLDYENGQVKIDRANKAHIIPLATLEQIDRHFISSNHSHRTYGDLLSKRDQVTALGIKWPESLLTPDQTESMINLLFDFIDIFGTENDEKPGTFNQYPVRVPTQPGKSIAVTGNHVPQALKLTATLKCNDWSASRSSNHAQIKVAGVVLLLQFERKRFGPNRFEPKRTVTASWSTSTHGPCRT